MFSYRRRCNEFLLFDATPDHRDRHLLTHSFPPRRSSDLPRPFVAAVWLESGPEITERDVLFAKAMIIHHQGAVEMARAYDGDPDGRNTFLRLLNLEIITDQSQEIALMQAVVDRFADDAAAIVVDPSMVHGMEMRAAENTYEIP